MRLPEPPSLDPAAVAQLEQASTPQSGCPGSGASVLAAFPVWYRELLVRFQEDEDALGAHLAGTTLDPGSLDALRGPPQGRDDAGLRLGRSKSAPRRRPLSLRSQILRGASFAAVAKAHSIDSTTAAARRCHRLHSRRGRSTLRSTR